jgi:beta-lactamase class A
MRKELSRRELLIGAGTISLGLAGVELAKTTAPAKAETVWDTPEESILSPEMQGLQEGLTSEIAKSNGKIAVAITNVLTGESINVNGDVPHLPGCVSNLTAAFTAIAELERGTALFTKEQIEPHMFTMVRQSNPFEGKNVYELIGGGSVINGLIKVNEQMQEWGMKGSVTDHPPAYYQSKSYLLKGENNIVVPNELNNVLARLSVNKLFENIENNEYAREIMRHGKPGQTFMIPRPIPSTEADIGHKVGWWNIGNSNTINDAAFVRAWNGSYAYSMVAMYENHNGYMNENTLFAGPGGELRNLSAITFSTLGKPQ